MRIINAVLVSAFIGILLGGCTTVQRVQKLDITKPHNVCIVEHKETREEVLAIIQEVINTGGIKTQVIPGTYVIKNNQWVPTYQIKDAASCDAVLFYVANWTWDITMYMHFANIWVVTPDEVPIRLGSASYDSRASLNKYINAHDKIVELTSGLFGLHSGPINQQRKIEESTKNNAGIPEPKLASPNASTQRDDADQLKKLKTLNDQGVISDEEYNKKKKEILERM